LRLANFRAGNKIRIGFSCEISYIQISFCGGCDIAVQIVEPEDILNLKSAGAIYIYLFKSCYEAELHSRWILYNPIRGFD